MPDTALDDLPALSPIPGSAIAYFVSSATDYQGSVTNLFVGRTLSATVALGIRSSGAAFDLQIASSEVLTANRTLSIVLGDAARTLTIGASASVSGNNTGDQASVSGNAGTATALQTARTINGVSFDGTGNITVDAAAGSLTGATLAAGVTASSLTSFGASPTLTTPTISGAITFPDNVRQTFNPGANAAGLNVGSLAGDPDTPSNGDLWYDSTANELTARINGANVALGAGGGGGANTALSNLAAVAINTDLLPASTQSLGSATLPWLSTFTGNTTQYESVTQSAGAITHEALGSAATINLVLKAKGTNPVVSFGGTSASFPGLSFSGTELQVVTASFSDTANLRAKVLKADLTLNFGSTTLVRMDVNAGNTGLNITNSSQTSLLDLGVSNLRIYGASNLTLDLGLARNATKVLEVNNGTAGQWGSLLTGVRDAGTTTVTTGLSIGHQSSGTPAAKFGAAMAINANSSTTADQSQSLWYSAWQTATHASRRSFAGVQSLSNGQALADRMIFGCTKTVGTNNTAITLCDIALPTLQGCAGELIYKVFAKDATNVQVRSGIIRYSGVNKAAAYTTEIVIVSEAASVSAGTLTATASVTTGTNLITLNLTPNTSLTATTYYIEWSLINLSESTVTVYTD